MSVKIIPIEDHEKYSVNGKTVYKNGEGNWLTHSELSTQEHKAFDNYKTAIIDNPQIKKHTKSEYKGS